MEPAGLTQIEEMVGRVINLFVGLSFIALVVMLVWAGIKFLTSGGEPKSIQSASQTVTWALLGMLFLVIVWLVLQLVANFTGIDVLKGFNIKVFCGTPDATGKFPWCP